MNKKNKDYKEKGWQSTETKVRHSCSQRLQKREKSSLMTKKQRYSKRKRAAYFPDVTEIITANVQKALIIFRQSQPKPIQSPLIKKLD